MVHVQLHITASHRAKYLQSWKFQGSKCLKLAQYRHAVGLLRKVRLPLLSKPAEKGRAEPAAFCDCGCQPCFSVTLPRAAWDSFANPPGRDVAPPAPASQFSLLHGRWMPAAALHRWHRAAGFVKPRALGAPPSASVLRHCATPLPWKPQPFCFGKMVSLVVCTP